MHPFSPTIKRSLRSQVHVFRRTSASSASLPLPVLFNNLSTSTPPPSPTHSPLNKADFARNRVTSTLLDAISRGYNSSRVWSYYMTAVNVLGQQNVPLEIHQQVLRHCTASAAELRVSTPRRLLAGNKPENPHIHEGRFQIIIRNIRSMGINPTLDDYHFILEQFAAVGHQVGAMMVFKELVHIGITPRAKTFGLCLQAIAHRLSLPIYKEQRERITLQAKKMLDDLIDDMRKCGVPLMSANFDLSFRILKETLDESAFESLVKWGYGIDLANPDRLPLEYQDPGSLTPQLGNVPLLSPLEFSTSALNTTLDVLGRLGNVSRLIQTFEVLTQPLPNADRHLFSSFDDEHDFGDTVDISLTSKPPHALPNTTTYNILLRHLCRLGHATLARHYILQAMSLDRQTDRKLRHQVYYALNIRQQRSLDNILAPHFAINCGTLLSVLGQSNRDKNLGLMRWLSTKMARIVRKKKLDLSFYLDTRQRLLNTGDGCNIGEQTRSLRPSTFLRPDTPRVRGGSLTSRTPLRDVKPDSLFTYSLDETSPSPMKSKHFNINLHITILERDIRELEVFTRCLQDTLGRTTQRIKERLGRRVWAGKDIYLSTEAKGRTIISRDKWRGIVGFRPRNSEASPRQHSSRS